ncbi:MAG: RAMP superfamily CRISPR-associated protein [Maritimibacter sp.]
MSYYKFKLSITLRAPWITPGDVAAGPATDIVLARDVGGNFIIPGTLLKGNLRAAAEVLLKEQAPHVERALFDRLFGGESSASDDRGANDPNRGQLVFPDLATDARGDETNRTVRIEIDPELGAAKAGHLLYVECPFPFGTEVTFLGDVLFLGASTNAANEARVFLQNALDRVFALGGMKSVGYGRVMAAHVAEPELVASPSVSLPGKHLALRYSIDRPFVVDAVRHNGNLSVGSDTIPGAAIKGALARGVARSGISVSEDLLASLVVGHAHPEGQRPLPLSLSTSGGKLYCNLGNGMPSGAHKFQGDWKDKGTVRNTLCQRFGDEWTANRPERSGRSRTRIESTSLTAYYEENGDGTGEAQALFGLLEAGLPGLGKTGAKLTAKSITDFGEVRVPNGTLNLTLTSDACLFAPYDLQTHAVGELYRAYFENLGFTLKDFFARQVMKGGYLALRYPAQEGQYIPWVLTQAGSVFQVEPTGKPDIAGILTKGLPPAKELSPDWGKFPFLRENGFGHVVHNILDHAVLSAGVDLVNGGAS